MATPHVAGIVAYLIAKDGNLTPAAMASKLISMSISGAVSGVRKSPVNLLSSKSYSHRFFDQLRALSTASSSLTKLTKPITAILGT